jgi:hypothetical protein
MVSRSLNPFSDVTDQIERDAIVKILSLLHIKDQQREDLLHAIDGGSSSEYLLHKMQMFGLVQSDSEDGYLTISERGEFAFDDMQ